MIKLILLSLLGLIVVFWFVFVLIKRIRRKKTKVDYVDSLNVVMGIGKKEEMEKTYKELMKLIHPDKNPDKIELSEKYSVLLNESRRDYAKMKSLKIEIGSVFNG